MSKNHTDRLSALRKACRGCGFDGILVPSADEYQGEYTPPCAARLAWLTGFDGSSGVAVVLPESACLLVPALYALRARTQTDPALYTVDDSAKTSVGKWLAAHAAPGAKIGYDPRLHTIRQIEGYRKALAGKDITLASLRFNLIDSLWEDRPPTPATPVELFPEALAGRSAADKRALAARSLCEEGACACVLTMPDSIAWLLNIRGADLSHVPVALSYAILDAQDGTVTWFIASERVCDDLRRTLGADVVLRAPSEFTAALETLAGGARAAGLPIALDLRTAPAHVHDTLIQAGAQVQDLRDPCIDPRACKTLSEQTAMIEAHRRDGLAMVRALAWLAREAGKGTLTELDVSAHFLSCRARDSAFRGTSFDTIAAFNDHAAMPHYRPVPESNARIVPPGILLIDSGGLYCSGDAAGTTDITRTLAVGIPTVEMKQRNTLVLKGHIALARAVFPEGTPGAQIDTLARQFLWAEGLDYGHGTGHGVGCFLSVHEEAARLSPKGADGIRAGMILSNEPGYYQEGAYGIRIESLVLVREMGATLADGRKMLGFETISLAPFDRALIDTGLLAPEERIWIDAYHAQVRAAYAGFLDSQDLNWLLEVTAAL